MKQLIEILTTGRIYANIVIVHMYDIVLADWSCIFGPQNNWFFPCTYELQPVTVFRNYYQRRGVKKSLQIPKESPKNSPLPKKNKIKSLKISKKIDTKNYKKPPPKNPKSLTPFERVINPSIRELIRKH